MNEAQESVLTERELASWGEARGAELQPPAVLLLSGELGAGKTTLTQAICRGYGVRDEVTSPTFALVHEYNAPKSPVYHVDLYRLKGPSELENIGWDDLVRSNAILIVEWPERAGNDVPGGAMRLELQQVAGEPDRRRLIHHTRAAVLK